MEAGILQYLLFGGGMYMILIGALWLMQDSHSAVNRYFASMYASTGLIVLYAWAERTRLIFSTYVVYNLEVPLCFFFAPFLYYGFCQIADVKHRPFHAFWPFIPAILTTPLVIAVNLLHPEAFLNMPPGAGVEYVRNLAPFHPIHVLGLCSNVYILFFLSLILIKGYGMFRDRDLTTVKELRLLLLFVALFFMDIVIMSIAHLLKSVDFVHFAKFLSSATFIAFSFYCLRYPEYTKIIIGKARQIRYKNTQLNGLDTDAVLERLDYLMSSDAIYRDMELSLPVLSEQLMVKPHQLSEILNERLGLNFNAYLNEYRVREAQNLLSSSPEKSVIEIAFEVGFNSKAAFNANFLKVTGVSPSDYRKASERPNIKAEV
jgi:AraC-like DNA-binding protein